MALLYRGIRTAPNSTNINNFSTIPNINPHNGKAGRVLQNNNYPNSKIPTTTNDYIITTSLKDNYSNSIFQQPDWNYSNEYNNLVFDSYPSYKVKVTANLRKQKSKQSAILISIPQGNLVKIIDYLLGDWSKIEYHGKIGYIHKKLITQDFESNNRVADFNATKSIEIDTSLYVLNETLNTKQTFVIKSCTFSTNTKDYKPSLENVTGRFVVLDSINNKWIFYTAKTDKYKIIKKELGIYEEGSLILNQITYQVIDKKMMH